ncbi:MAG: polysaccharide deacetylase family protein, partial [Opitutaceae bacterium]
MPTTPATLGREKTLLLGVDLEEFYVRGCEPAATASPLDQLVEPLLKVFANCHVRGTFFTVGELARRHPDLVRRIAAAGHEIACHGDRHLPLTRLTPAEFAADLQRNCEAITTLGLPAPVGFRAPLLSLGAEQQWAFAVLRDSGFVYSSSVMPARTPLYGWPSFGGEPRICDGVLEAPVTVSRVGPLRIPCFCGTYYRVLPDIVARWLISRASRRRPVCGYIHPYDFDHRQPRTVHAELQG